MSNIVAEMTPWDVIEAIKLVAYVIGICKAAVSIYVLLAKLASWIQKKLTTLCRAHTPSMLLTLFREKIDSWLLKNAFLKKPFSFPQLAQSFKNFHNLTKTFILAFLKKPFSPRGSGINQDKVGLTGIIYRLAFLKKLVFHHGETHLSPNFGQPYFKKILSFA